MQRRLPDTVQHWPIDRLRPHGRNPRTHSDEQVAQIAASIVEFGWTNPVLASSEGEVIAGTDGWKPLASSAFGKLPCWCSIT